MLFQSAQQVLRLYLTVKEWRIVVDICNFHSE